MPVAPDPSEIFERAVEEGQRRLEQSPLELASTSFIAGFTVVFGVVALGIVEGAIGPHRAVAKVAGALAFGPGLVFLVVGRTELFNENFFDPTATVVKRSGSRLLPSLLRLWVLTFVFNLAGGVLMALVFSVNGVVPSGTPVALRLFAEELARRSVVTGFASAIAGGALVTLLSFLLAAVNSVGSRIAVAYMAGVLLALGPFDHVIVTVIHVVFGILFGAPIPVGTLVEITATATAGNLVGGLGLVTLTHVTQVMGARE